MILSNRTVFSRVSYLEIVFDEQTAHTTFPTKAATIMPNATNDRVRQGSLKPGIKPSHSTNTNRQTTLKTTENTSLPDVILSKNKFLFIAHILKSDVFHIEKENLNTISLGRSPVSIKLCL